MKTSKSFAYSLRGIIAVVLFALGFTRAAAHVDPTAPADSSATHCDLSGSPCIFTADDGTGK